MESPNALHPTSHDNCGCARSGFVMGRNVVRHESKQISSAAISRCASEIHTIVVPWKSIDHLFMLTKMNKKSLLTNYVDNEVSMDSCTINVLRQMLRFIKPTNCGHLLFSHFLLQIFHISWKSLEQNMVISVYIIKAARMVSSKSPLLTSHDKCGCAPSRCVMAKNVVRRESKRISSVATPRCATRIIIIVVLR